MPDKRIFFLFENSKKTSKNSKDDTHKNVCEDLKNEKSFENMSSSLQDDKGSLMMEKGIDEGGGERLDGGIEGQEGEEEEEEGFNQQRRNSMPHSPTNSDAYSNNKNNNIKYNNEESKNIDKSPETSLNSNSENEDIDSYFNDYQTTHNNNIKLANNDNYSNSSKNSLTSIPEIGVGTSSGLKENKSPLISVGRENKLFYNSASKEPLGLKVSRSSSMLKRLVKRRTDFANKSMSEDLSVDDPAMKQRGLKGLGSPKVYNSNPLKQSGGWWEAWVGS